MFDTRSTIRLLLDYNLYYKENKVIEDAERLIESIPSETLIDFISWCNINLYLKDNSSDSGQIQAILVNALLNICGNEAIITWTDILKEQTKLGHEPILLWSYSNLLFYNLIFKKYNRLPVRNLTSEDANKLFDSYLIVNSIVNARIEIAPKDIKAAMENDKVEKVLMPQFIYQRDYASTSDYTNQVVRGELFFKYLEDNPKYCLLTRQYLESIGISSYLDLCKNLMILIVETKLGEEGTLRSNVAQLEGYEKNKQIDLTYIEQLCINNKLEAYKEDVSFGLLRSKFLYKITQYNFYILDFNFLIDQFYKSQVFGFNSFLKMNGIKNEFLSEKAKEYTEAILLPHIFNICFPHSVKFFGDDCKNSNSEELCDVYLREGNKICLIEFKDVLLNAEAKNSGNEEILLSEFNKKFIANQKGKPKGLSQIINAIDDIEKNKISFDNISDGPIEIYPILLYTDLSFGIEGVNKMFKEDFKQKITAKGLKAVIVNDITFINLNFFELKENYLAQGMINLFNMIDSYHSHTKQVSYSLTSFEVYTRYYLGQNCPQDLGLTKSYQAVLTQIMKKIDPMN